jgi:hypothetical protein
MDGYIADGYKRAGHHCPEDAAWFAKAQVGSNTWTYVTASGTKIGGLHDGAKILGEFRKLPEAERRPKVQEDPDPEKGIGNLRPPARGLTARLYNTALEKRADGEIARASKSFTDCYASSGGCVEPALTQIDMLWMREVEVLSIVPAEPKVGASFRMPDALERRMIQFTVPCANPVGDQGEFTLTVTSVSAGAVDLRLEGWSRQGVSFNDAKDAFAKSRGEGKRRASVGQATRWLGFLKYDLTKKAFTSFDIVGIGDVWGEAANRKYGAGAGAEPRKWPAGYAFELAKNSPADRITPPQMVQQGLYNRDLTDWYWGAKKP